MGMIPTFCRALIWLHKEVGLKGPLLTLGNQDVWASYEDLKSFFNEMDCPYLETTPIPHTSRLLNERPEAADFVHASTLFEMMGIPEYDDIDKFEIDLPRIVHDLNTPVPAELSDRFNLIIDSGTIEHVFDVRQVMKNILRMSRKGGWILHISPASNFVDHGFYSFSPCFFYDFYQVNGFGNFTCYILQPDLENLYERSPFFEYSYGMNLSGMLEPGKHILVFFAAKKLTDADDLVIPNQGMYSSSEPTHDQELIAAQLVGTTTGSLAEKGTTSWLPLSRPIRSYLETLGRKSVRNGPPAAQYKNLGKI